MGNNARQWTVELGEGQYLDLVAAVRDRARTCEQNLAAVGTGESQTYWREELRRAVALLATVMRMTNAEGRFF